MVKLYVCKICGEPYLGGEAPDDCPFCGAPKRYMDSPNNFSEIWDGELNEGERETLRETLDLEVNATAFYLDVANGAKKYSRNNRLFKQLARVEREHAEVAAKFLDVDLPEFKGEESRGSVERDLERTKELETEAIAKYEGFLGEVESSNLKNFFVALIHAEKGHRDISEDELGKL
jgi:rubrerythrin